MRPGIRRVAGIVVAALAFTSCARGPRVYLVTDPAVITTLGGRAAAERMLRAALSPRGFDGIVTIAANEAEVTAQIEAAAADPLARIVLSIPAIPLDLAPWAEAHPTILFAGYGGGARVAVGNLLSLAPGREDAFRAAGKRVGELAAGVPVGILAASPTETGMREIEAFRAGLAESGAAPAYYRESRSLTDKTAAVRALKELREEGSRFLLLKTYGLTSACLEAMDADEDRAVVEDCGAAGGCGESVILSIETDWERTLGDLVSSADGRAWKAASIAERWVLRGAGDGSAP